MSNTTTILAGLDVVSIDEVRSTYKRLQPSGHWFDERTMRFFGTKLHPQAVRARDGRLFFLTRETNPAGVQAWSVRVQEADGDISTVGEFHSNRTEYKGLQALRSAVIEASVASQEC